MSCVGCADACTTRAEQPRMVTMLRATSLECVALCDSVGTLRPHHIFRDRGTRAAAGTPILQPCSAAADEHCPASCCRARNRGARACADGQLTLDSEAMLSIVDIAPPA
eukprot:1664064-Prymnesium_polylepis.2